MGLITDARSTLVAPQPVGAIDPSTGQPIGQTDPYFLGIKGELGTFLSPGNLNTVLHEGTVPAIVGLGMLLVLISGGIDLSVGAVVALVTVATMLASDRPTG